MKKNVYLAQQPETYDAIVVGSGIAGGWAAKELTEKGLKTLVIERGRNVEHVTDYITEHKAPWEFELRGNVDPKVLEEDYFVQRRTGFLSESVLHFFFKDSQSPYVEEKPFTWVRGNQTETYPSMRSGGPIPDNASDARVVVLRREAGGAPSGKWCASIRGDFLTDSVCLLSPQRHEGTKKTELAFVFSNLGVFVPPTCAAGLLSSPHRGGSRSPPGQEGNRVGVSARPFSANLTALPPAQGQAFAA